MQNDWGLAGRAKMDARLLEDRDRSFSENALTMELAGAKMDARLLEDRDAKVRTGRVHSQLAKMDARLLEDRDCVLRPVQRRTTSSAKMDARLLEDRDLRRPGMRSTRSGPKWMLDCLRIETRSPSTGESRALRPKWMLDCLRIETRSPWVRGRPGPPCQNGCSIA